MVLAPALDLERHVERLPATAERGGKHASKRDEAISRLPGGIVDEARVDAERNVVNEPAVVCAADVHAAFLAREGGQGGEGIVGIEPEIAREVIPRPERDAHEGPVVLDGDARDGR